jgi:hypothetical protein
VYAALPRSDSYAPSDFPGRYRIFIRLSPSSTLLTILPGISRVPMVGLKCDDGGGVFLGAPSALCGSRDCAQGKIRLTCDPLLARLLGARSGPNPSRMTGSFGALAALSGKVCQGLHDPKGSARFVRLTMSSLSQALPLEALPSSHRAFQEHAAHSVRWPAMLSSKGAWGTCIPQGLATFLP